MVIFIVFFYFFSIWSYNFEINFYDQDDISKKDIPDFEKLLLKFNENYLLKLKLTFEINSQWNIFYFVLLE